MMRLSDCVGRLFAAPGAPSLWTDDQPIRAELFGIERLEDHARHLAAAQAVGARTMRGLRLARRLEQNGAVLLSAYGNLVAAVDAGLPLTPAAEWLVDNFHLLEKQVREISTDLPPDYYRQLPKLLSGPLAGYPRIFGIAWAFVAHTDSNFDSATLLRFVHAYQEVQPLTIGELWAVSITLRIVLIENLRRLAGQIIASRAARRQADDLADKLLGTPGPASTPLPPGSLTPDPIAHLSDAFAVQLVHRLRDQDPSVTPTLEWLHRRLAAQGMTADSAVQDVHRSQVAANVTVRNIITSLRLIADVEWSELFERASLVDAALATGSTFIEMDFATRNLYRGGIEDLARGSRQTELDIARAALARAVAAPAGSLASDTGYHLLAGGRRDFEAALGYRMEWRQWPIRLSRTLGIGAYAGAIGGTTAAMLAGPLAALGSAGSGFTGLGEGALAGMALAGAIPAIDAAVAVVNRLVTAGIGATRLPALSLREGVPPHLRTLVVVPTLLTSLAAIKTQVERLEIHHLASPEGDLYFALLSDWADAASEAEPADADLLAAAVAGIERLNLRYGPAPEGPRFLLLHRHRQWSESEGAWIGWERKRGKLHELNGLLRGDATTSFLPGPAPPEGVRYVVTLDADTRLPRDTVRRLIGKMAHPLNRPRLDDVSGRVVEGYAVLQPRVSPSLPVGREGSLFQRIFSSVSGIDPYASAVSDVYQDLFGEGSYAGKGIYDVDAFAAAMAGRVPDSTLLSHDLFEGIFARAGLASDVEVVEEFPARYDAGALRLHRWARGDWQLLPWIFGYGPQQGPRGAIPAIGRWKMLDNLRRTLSAPAAVLALFVGWMLPFHAALIWTLFVLATIALPALIPVLAAVPPRRTGISIASHLRALGGDVRLGFALCGLDVTLLAHQAWLMGDAVLRTIWRLTVSRRHLLEWIPAAQATLGDDPDVARFYRWMAGSVAIGGVAVLAGLGGGNRALAVPFGLLWLAAPAVAWWVSRPPGPAKVLVVSAKDAVTLRLVARRTWRFFETFVTPLEHMLPPDNFQEDPAPVIAHRTSPTNLGLYLLAVASARDFGWIGLNTAITRLEATLATMSGLARYRGHFYNWYDTRDLRPLEPPYISSVDSGNLAGHLIALANACREWREPAIATPWSGIADTVALAADEARLLDDGHRTQTVTWLQLDEAIARLGDAVRLASAERASAADHLAALAVLAEAASDIAGAFSTERDGGNGGDIVFWTQACKDTIASHQSDLAIGDTGSRLQTLEDIARTMATSMEFGFLLDPERKLFAIGYRVPEAVLDNSCYDLLASEARLASFVAIAKGDIPARHWFRLGRAVTPVNHSAALISWSGSMFEYLMPSLVMRAPEGSLLAQTSCLVVRRQIAYAAGLELPWGISESAYNARDMDFTYQYSNFGVPGLGLKRGLGASRVVAPYATALATMVDPRAACANLARLEGIGARGRHGFYEALDYTAARLPGGDTVAIVRAYMAHHQGMSIVAIADALLDGVMRKRFHAEAMIRATELLLQERPPRDIVISHPWAAEVTTADADASTPAGGRRYGSARQATPATHLLSNGRVMTMITAAGSGYSRWGDIALTRWREDATCDDGGSYIYLRDVQTGRAWSAGYQPSGAEPDEYGVTFNEDHARFTRRDGTLTTAMDVVISAEDDAEMRCITLTNGGPGTREIEITSYAELALAPQAADVAHPAFSKLFIQTEYRADLGALIATRRRRSPTEPEIWAAHLAVTRHETVGMTEYETDRARFLGRGHSLRTPIAVLDGRPLSGTTGTVLDPVFALRRRVRVAAGAMVHIAFWTIVADSRQALLDLIDTHRDTSAHHRAATLAWSQAQVQLHHLGISASEAALFQRLASHVLFTGPALRPFSDTILRGAGPQSGLWGLGISGDLPIVLLRIADNEHINIAHELLQAHDYWRLKQFDADLVILNERQASYVQDLQTALESLARSSQSRRPSGPDRKGGRIFVLRTDLIPATTRALLNAAARVVMVAQRGRLADQLDRIATPFAVQRPPPARVTLLAGPAPDVPALEFGNGLGGFAENGREYVTVLGPGQSTPAPWSNVIANPAFGFQVASEGGGTTWSVNSRENQLTPWSNDPVSNYSGEAFYLRDEDSGVVWSPTAQPIRDDRATYVARHGRGYSRFTHIANGIEADLLQFVPLDAALKISRLVLRNRTGQPRRLSVTAYVEWVLGAARAATLPFVATTMDTDTGALFATNKWSAEFGDRVAFLDMRGAQTEWTGDRRSFIGRNGALPNPAALSGVPLSNTTGAGLDPCGELRQRITLAAGAQVEIVTFLGQSQSAEAARTLLIHYRAADLDAEMAEVSKHWDEILGAITVTTPSRAMDIMLNGWLLYQTLACRVWARAGFYQASGAYGFRDQLQDGMALAAIRPALTRAHLLRAAARQFEEGDVQHWWLPHTGQGVRTRISDDRAWLATTVAHYLTVTGDIAVLDTPIPFLEGQALKPGEHDIFFFPAVSDRTATLFEHCARALDHSLAIGAHGLPLIGTGDWNDGMNRVGERGEGESVWLAWFLHAALMAFAPLADARHETERAAVWRTHAASLSVAIERDAWDGNWYRRGYFDDGTPLGSAASAECRIDAIAQSWAVLSGAGDHDRAVRAMAEVTQQLIRPADGLALLFAPPFDTTPLDPGYIKGYPPGIRENGGQYTHAALWSVMAFAALGDGDKAEALFSLLNPINHARTRAEVHRYKVEPYVIAADIYARPPHVGRGGWTWYTGSAGWMQRAGIESILGLRLQAGTLLLNPCIPAAWPGFTARLRHGGATYEIAVTRRPGAGNAVVAAMIDGRDLPELPLRLVLEDDGQVHRLDVTLG